MRMNYFGVRSRIASLVGLLLVACVGCASDPSGAVNRIAPKGTGFQLLSFNDARGKTHNYSVFVPLNYNAKKSSPAILFLHGQFEGGSDGKKCTTVGIGQAIKRNVRTWDFLTIFPQSGDGTWNDDSEFNIALGALDDAERRFAIDPNRVILTGLSTGGEGTWLLGARAIDRFAAFVPICAGAETQTVPVISRRPVWAFHNQGDPFRMYGGAKKMNRLILAAGGNSKLTGYGGFLSHNAWDRAYSEPELLPWMRQQRLTNAKSSDARLASVDSAR